MKHHYGIQLKRVVITGMGVISPFGRGADMLMDSLANGDSAVKTAPELEKFDTLRSRVAARIPDFDPKEIPRKHRRTMSKMSVYATLASSDALDHAGLDERDCSSGKMGIAIGSSVGSSIASQEFYENFLTDHSFEWMKSNTFFQIMNHSCAANVSQALGVTGRILATSAACATSCQAVGYGFEMIAFGKQDQMLCGGAEEFHPLIPATFDTLNAASINFNHAPAQTPRPFDRDRDGVVCGEGSAVLLLESMDSALGRNAPIWGEIVGFGTASDSSHIANPNASSMELCMRNALADATLEPEQIDYVNAHATGTEQGDIAESEAIHSIFGRRVPVTSLKGHLGHTMAASGAIELVATVYMMNQGLLVPTRNLDNVDEACKKIEHVTKLEKSVIKTALKNNFAFGGVNSSIALRRYEND